MFDINPIELSKQVPAIIAGLTVHEFAHGYVAYKLGDPTAKRAGRLTLNPLAHIDPAGFLLLFIVHFGWAKPVPVDPKHFRNVRQGMLLVSVAGPLANVLLALFAAVLIGLGLGATPYVVDVLVYLVVINLILAVFNLIPIPPLDGSKILAGILPGSQEWLYRLDQYGIVLLVMLMALGVTGQIIDGIVVPLAGFLIDFASTFGHSLG